MGKKLYGKYGLTPDYEMIKRVKEEWEAMKNSDSILDIAMLNEFVLWLKKERIPYWMSGTAGSSFILYLLGITRGNPLKPHFYCLECKHVDWVPNYRSGFAIEIERYNSLCGE